MASNIDKLRDRLVGRSSNELSTTAKQIQTLEKRIKGAGLEVEKEKDNRNIVEKALNLTPDQNVLFDVFEVIGRPQQAVFGAIESAQKGKDVLKGLKEGFTGEKFTSGKDLLTSMDKSFAKSALGFGLDVLADPLDLAFIAAAPFTGGTSLAGLALNAKDVAKVADGIRIAAKAQDSAKVADLTKDLIVKGGGKLQDFRRKDTLANATKDILKIDKGMAKKSINDIIFGQAFKGLKKAGGFSSEIIGKGYKKAFGEDAFNKASEAIKSAKTTIKDSFTTLGGLTKGKKSQFKDIEGKTNLVKTRAQATLEAIDDEIMRFTGAKVGKLDEAEELISKRTKATNGNAKKALNDGEIKKFKDSSFAQLGGDLEEQLLNMTEYIDDSGNVLKYDTTIGDFLKNFGRFPKQAETTELMTKLSKILGKEVADEVTANGQVWYSMNKLARKELRALGKEFLAETIAMPSLRTSEQIAELQRLLQDKDFMELFKSVSSKLKGMRKDLINIDPNLTTDFLERSGYVRHALAGDSAVGVGRLNLLRKEIGEDAFNKLRETTDGTFENMLAELADTNPALAQSIRNDVDFLERVAGTRELRREERIFRGNEATVQRRAYRLSVQEANNVTDIFATSALNKIDSARAKIDDVKALSKADGKGIEALANASDAKIEKINARKDLTKEQAKQLKKQAVKDTWFARVDDVKDKKMIDTTYIDRESMFKLFKNKDTKALEEFLRPTTIKKFINAKNVPRKAIEKEILDFYPRLGHAIQISDFKKSARKIENVKKNLKSESLREFLASASGRKLFEDNLIAAMDDWIDKVPRLTKESAQIDNILLNASFEPGQGRLELFDDEGKHILDENGVKQYRAFGKIPIHQKVPIGTKELTTTEASRLANKLREIKGRTDNQALENLLVTLDTMKSKTEKFVVDNRVLTMISFMSKKESVSGLLKMVDGVTNLFKRTKLLSPGFQIRNFLGNATNMALGGVPVGQIPKHYARADSILKTAPGLMKRRAAGEILDSTEQAILRNYEEFLSLGFSNVNRDLYGITESMVDTSVAESGRTVDKVKASFNRVNQFNADLNEAADLRFRMAFYIYMKKNPKKYFNLGVTNAGDATRKVMFDPTDLNSTERNLFRRIVPFYTFTKKNLAFQMENFTKNTSNYNRLRKIQRAMWEDVAGIEEEDLRQYQLENFWIPTFAKDKNGNPIAIKSNLPVSDLGEFLSSPINKTIGSANALLRFPFEKATGTQLFSGQPIERFEGERARSLNASLIGLPQANFNPLSRDTEFLLENIGVDVPLKTLGGLIGTTRGLIQGEGISALSDKGTIGTSFLTGIDANKNRASKEFVELKRTQDLIKSYKQRGVDIPTIKELEAKSSNRYRDLIRRIKGN